MAMANGQAGEGGTGGIYFLLGVILVLLLGAILYFSGILDGGTDSARDINVKVDAPKVEAPKVEAPKPASPGS
jgi:hypothetical protein